MKSQSKLKSGQAPSRAMALDAQIGQIGGRAAAVALALFLGAFFLSGVGFSPMAHEMAHDTRHATGFPCH